MLKSFPSYLGMGEPEAGLELLDDIQAEAVSGYQPYWAVRAHILQKLRKTAEASEAYDRAIGLAEDPAVREFLLQNAVNFFSEDVEIAPPRPSPIQRRLSTVTLRHQIER